MKDIPIEKQFWFQNLLERTLPAVHNRERRRPHHKSHVNIGFVHLYQAGSRRWRNLPTDKVNFNQNLVMLDMKRLKKALET